MKLWMSAEMMIDVADPYRLCRNYIENKVNELLALSTLSVAVEKWAYIAIMLEEDNPDYQEVVKKTSKGKTLEFRLKIPYERFRDGDGIERIRLILESLRRSIDLMETLGVPRVDQDKLREIMRVAERSLLSTCKS